MNLQSVEISKEVTESLYKKYESKPLLEFANDGENEIVKLEDTQNADI